jgi:hypothetical protein
MLSKHNLLAFAVILVCSVLASAQTPATSVSTPATNRDDSAVGTISGSVVNESGQPLAGVPVFVRALNSGTPGRSSTTDAEGNFRVNGLIPALYFVSASSPAYVMDEAEVNTPSRNYRIGDTVRIQMIRGGVITGTVTNAAGEPLIGVPVRASIVRDAKGQRPKFGAFYFMERSTDDRGVYRIFGLVPGTYVVGAGGPGYSPRMQLNPYESDVPTWAPSSPREGAAELSVRGGEEVSADIRYRGESGHTIRGSVKVSGVNASVALSSVTGGFMPFSSAFQMPGSNSFVFNGVADGEYVLVAQAVPSAMSLSVTQTPDLAISEPRRITVKGADVSGIELVPRPLASINGRVALEPSKVAECQGKRSPLFPEMIVRVERPEKDVEQDPVPFLRLISGSASPDAKGGFVIRNLIPARYMPQLQFYGRYWYLDSISIAATPKFDAAANWTTLKWGERADLTITLAQGAASIRGKVSVEGAGGSPARLGVYLLPADREKSADVLRYFVTSVAADGTFAFNNLPPGRYLTLLQTIDADTSSLAKLRLPEAVDARTKLRRAAEAQKTNLELKPCQNLTDFQLKQ